METALLTTQEVARRLSLSAYTVREYARLGRIQHLKLGGQFRFRAEHLTDFEQSLVPQPVAVAVATRPGRRGPRW